MIKRSSSSFARRPLTTALTALLCVALTPAPQAFAQIPSKRTRAAEQQVTLNFVNAEIEGVSRAIGAMLKQQFVVDPRVKGQITLYSEEPLTTREAYMNFLAALRGQGFTVVESGGLFKVVPEADAKLQSDTVSVGAVSRRGDQIITQIFKINHENANNLVPVLRPLISPNNTINANPGNNTLVITDYADNLSRIAKIISAMDTASAGDVDVITLKHVVAADIAPTVQRLTDAAGGAAGPGAAPAAPGSTTAPAIMVDSRTNSLIVRAPNAARMNSIRSVVAKLDQPVGNATAAGNIYVVYLRNADAVKLAAVLRAAHAANTPAGATGGGAAASGGTTNQTQQNNMASSGNSATGQSAQSTAPVTASAGPSTGGFIQADPANNALIITAPEPLYRQLRAVIDQLDSRRAQVYIESMIVKVDANKMRDVGVQWQAISGEKGDRTIYGGGTNFGGGIGNIVMGSAATTGGVTAIGTALAESGPPNGFNLGLLRKIGNYYTLGALARFLESNADGNVLSTPNLVSLDNEEAKIVIGQNVPFITGTSAGTSMTNPNPFQTIERADVGLTLRVKPQIGENGTVRMTIYQENSSVTSVSANSGPTTDKSAIETTVVVDDGQIMVLGGLMKEEYSGSVSKVPLLGDIPFIGGLFRADNRTRQKTNLMVFLRPVVMRDQQAATDLSLDRYDAIRAIQQDQNTRGLSPVLPPVNVPAVGQPSQAAPTPLSDTGTPAPVVPSTQPQQPVTTPVTPAQVTGN